VRVGGDECRMWWKTYVLRDLLAAGGPLVFAGRVLGDALEGHECLGVEVALWVLGCVVGEQAVGEEVGGRVEGEEGQRAGEVVAVCGDGVADAFEAEGGHDIAVDAVGAGGHGHELLEQVQPERIDITTCVGLAMLRT
jgi:hypothetical protein